MLIECRNENLLIWFINLGALDIKINLNVAQILLDGRGSAEINLQSL